MQRANSRERNAADGRFAQRPKGAHLAPVAFEYCDGWFPHAVRPAYGNVLDMFPQFRQMATEAGRDADSSPITVYGVARDPDLIARYRDAGSARIVFELPSAGPEQILPLLDECAELISRI